MARGWESKAVESQMEASHSERLETTKRRLTPEEAAVQRRKDTLLLARAHLQQQIRASQQARHQAMLQNALEDLEKQLADLGMHDGPASTH